MAETKIFKINNTNICYFSNSQRFEQELLQKRYEISQKQQEGDVIREVKMDRFNSR